MSGLADTDDVVWRPTERQSAFLGCDDFEVLYGGAAGGGKALDILTPIPTPEGWRKMIDLQPGDSVFDEAGQVCQVLAISDVMVDRPCYRVEFSDGSHIVADEQHLWSTHQAGDNEPVARTTKQIRHTLREISGVLAHRIIGGKSARTIRLIMSVQPIESRPVKCIKVSSASHCYLAGAGMVPTHNSDSLLIDALCLQHGGPDNSHHRAALFRRSFPELRDLIDRALELYPLIVEGANYNQTEKVWTFPSGAKVEFGYLQHDNDRFKYRGRAWNYIGFDELTLWTTPVCYLYLFSRCRSADRSLPRYIRATTNPDGPGQKWVMLRWGIQADGRETNLPVDIVDEEMGTVTTVRRRFIPAKLSDNPHLTGTGYREALLQMDPEERESLLKGLWKGSKIKGAYYLNEMQKLRANGRIRNVPYQPGTPVNTFWDLGFNDTTAIWFHQFIAGEHRFIKAYENSGESLEHYAQYLLACGYVFGTHHLPHDAANRSLQTGKSAVELLQKLLAGHRFEVVPRIEAVITGINQTRMKMGGAVYIDEEACADGLAALDNYRKKYNEKQDVYLDIPLHDRYSNYADAFRQWGQIEQRGVLSTTSKRTKNNWRTA